MISLPQSIFKQKSGNQRNNQVLCVAKRSNEEKIEWKQ